MSDLNEQALPCPFCGGNDISQTETDGPKWGAMRCSCGAVGPEVRTGYGKQASWRFDALVEWNRRALPSPSTGEAMASTVAEATLLSAVRAYAFAFYKSGGDKRHMMCESLLAEIEGKIHALATPRPSAEAGEPVAWSKAMTHSLAIEFCSRRGQPHLDKQFPTPFPCGVCCADAERFVQSPIATPRPAQAEGSGDDFFRVFTSKPCTICGGERNWRTDGQLQAVCYQCGNPTTPQAKPPRVTRSDVDLLCGELHVGESEECRCQHCTDIKRILAAVEYVAALSRQKEDK